MTYAVGGLIQAADYNGFVSTATPNLNNIWSTGSGSSGYGQPALASVNVGDTIASNSWSSLITAISSAAAQQGTAITSVTPPTSGGLIQFYAALQNNLNAISAGQLNAAAVGTDITQTGSRTGNWGGALGIGVLTSTVTVTFGNANQARYFFNAGGTIRISCSRTGAIVTPQDTAWGDLCTNIGTLALPAVNTAQLINGTTLTGFTKIGGGGASPDIYVRPGYYQLTGTSQLLFRQLSSAGVYASDNIEISSSATATSVTFTVRFNDSTDGGSPDTVTGTMSVTATARTPSTTNLVNTWGTPTVTVSNPA
jgi:hypothetical protein